MQCEFLGPTGRCPRTAYWRTTNSYTTLDLCTHHYDAILRRRNQITPGSLFKATRLSLLPKE